MKAIMGTPALRGTWRSERGSGVYTFFGFLIIAIVVVGAIYLFGWTQIMSAGADTTLDKLRQAVTNHKWDEAIALYDKIIKAKPGSADAYIGRSVAYVNTGRLEDALKDVSEAVKKNPKSAVAYGQKAIVEKLLGKNAEAMEDFTKALELDDGYTWAYAQRADLYSRQNDHEKALADADKALKIAPKFADGYRVRAWVLSRMGKCKEAAQDFKKVMELKPDDAWSIQDRAWFLMTCPDEKLQDDAKAFELAQKATKLTEGKDAVIQETLAEAYFRQGDPAKAADLQKRAIALKSKSCPSGSCTEEMKERLKKYELAARKEVRKSYEILPLDSGYKP